MATSCVLCVIRSGTDAGRTSMRFQVPRLALALAAALPVGVVVAVAGPSAGAATGKSVVLRDIAFKPSKLTVARGAGVTFRFQDNGTTHNVISRGAKRFKSSPTKSAGTYAVRFTKPGVYRYECTLHIGMKGAITVR
jgi:plastocyanin